MQYNTCHNRNHKVDHNYITEFSTRLHKLTGIETKFKFKFKLNLNYKLKKTENKKTVTLVDQLLKGNQACYQKPAQPTRARGTGRLRSSRWLE
jgi:hypothetical protein